MKKSLMTITRSVAKPVKTIFLVLRFGFLTTFLLARHVARAM